MKTRANKGGELGINGETYKGGQFLPLSSETIKGAMGSADTKKTIAYMNKKQKVSRSQWETPASVDVVAIYPLLAGKENYDWDTGMFSLNENFVSDNIETRIANIDAFNSGQKWTARG